MHVFVCILYYLSSFVFSPLLYERPGPSEGRLTCRRDVSSGKEGLEPAPRSERKILMLCRLLLTIDMCVLKMLFLLRKLL